MLAQVKSKNPETDFLTYFKINLLKYNVMVIILIEGVDAVVAQK
jgi:hypothetical protein